MKYQRALVLALCLFFCLCRHTVQKYYKYFHESTRMMTSYLAGSINIRPYYGKIVRTLAPSFLILAALRSRCGQYIFVLWFLLLSSFFLVHFQPSQTGCLPYFHTWCGLSANLGCMSETCWTRLARNAGRKKSPKIRHLNWHHRTNKMLNIKISSTCSHNMANVGPLTGEIGSGVWGTPANFNGFLVLASLLEQRRSPEVN